MAVKTKKAKRKSARSHTPVVRKNLRSKKILSASRVKRDAAKKIQCIIYQEDDQFVALCLNTGVASQGDTYEEAVKNIKEAVELYLEDDDGTYVPITKGVTLTEQFING